MLEVIDEECMLKILNTGQNCPKTLLYLETGHQPACFHIFLMMHNFLKYILDQESSTLIPRCFIAQKENPTKGDWVNCSRKLMIYMNI